MSPYYPHVVIKINFVILPYLIKSCSSVYALVFLISSSLEFVCVLGCDQTPGYTIWLAV